LKEDWKSKEDWGVLLGTREACWLLREVEKSKEELGVFTREGEFSCLEVTSRLLSLGDGSGSGSAIGDPYPE